MPVTVQNISKLYGTQTALHNVSLDIPKGQVVGLLGPNGAGKSTLMKILTGYLPADAGKAIVNGFDVAIQPLEARRNTGYLPEHNPVYPDLYVREFLELMGRLQGLGRKAKKRAAEVIALTGITPEQHKKVGQLSKGYRQRVGLAQALLHDPETLILDEPTSGLDPNQLTGIRQLIQSLGRDHTVLLSTHIMQEVEAMCTRIVIINKGNIVLDKPTGAINLQTQSLEDLFRQLTNDN
ncbi:MAG: ATP-binding cassette domain-containing protein [Prevotellaceae bacterium]|jgi:ABC-2 type transport system ATP-binding protein|nr:ATP-binding cassette domain-containing protein [Prevotellaceae bacterium]